MLVIGEDEGLLNHKDVDVLMASYILKAAHEEKRVIQILSIDTDVFVILIYFVSKYSIAGLVLMERWDGSMLKITQIAKK